MSWTQEQGIFFAFSLEQAFSGLPDGARCHVALGGSVLHNGSSMKDLDILVYPRKKQKGQEWNWAVAAKFIEEHLGVPITLHSDKLPFQCSYTDEKRVGFANLPDGKRVDFFFLS